VEEHVAFPSVLYAPDAEPSSEQPQEPAYFRDLNLDQVVEAITADYGEYDLKPFFYTRLTTAQAIAYRHEVMRDLKDPSIFASVMAFGSGMRVMRGQLHQSAHCHYVREKQRWFLEAVRNYCAATGELARALAERPLRSRALTAFRAQLASYVTSEPFAQLLDAAERLGAELDRVRYAILINKGVVTVSNYANQRDYSTAVLRTFQKFQESAAKGYVFKPHDSSQMNHVEAQILDLVAALQPEVFANLARFWEQHRDFASAGLLRFDREVHFYIAFGALVEKLESEGLRFCFPRVSTTDKAMSVTAGFDVALALRLASMGRTVVCNDFLLEDEERILVISGPNQGGKTTFARAFGQMHHLAGLGCLVPGGTAQLFLADALFTHFERGENVDDQRGKLQDDLIRVHDLLRHATTNSVILLNEIFSATTLADASFLAREVLARITRLDALCVCVSFLDELATLNTKTVSMVATVSPENPNIRTYRLVRKAADGQSYALSLAAAHNLTYERLKSRIRS
jgi:DNA mismatch repair protein MutS